MTSFNVILIQEHWLFQFQIHKLGEIAAEIYFEGKSVDIQNNINPSQQPRGYGGCCNSCAELSRYLIFSVLFLSNTFPFFVKNFHFSDATETCFADLIEHLIF
jgi:hypothetical protein